jgi:hypothetical protein
VSNRTATETVDIDIEDTLATLNGDFDTAKKRVYAYDLTQVCEYPEKEHDAYTQDLGENAPTVGYPYEISEMKHKCALIGLDQAFTSTQAEANGLALAIGLQFGVDCSASSRRSTGTTIAAASSPTVTSVEETDADSHAVGQLMSVEQADGSYRVRLITGYTAAVATLFPELPAPPAEGAALPGGVHAEWSDADAAALPTAQAEVLGFNLNQHRRHLGLAPNGMRIPEKGVSEVTELEFDWRTTDFNDLFSKTRVPSLVPLPTIQGGGEWLLGARGEDAYADLVVLKELRVGFEFASGLFELEDHGNCDIGLEGWGRGEGARTVLTLTVPDDTAAPTGLTSGESTLRESWRARKRHILDRFFFLGTWGCMHPKQFTVFCPDLVMVGAPQIASVGKGRPALKYMFAPISGGDSPRCRVRLG